MNKLKHTFYNDGGYSIGETGDDKYITGIGYILSKNKTLCCWKI